MNNTIIIKLFWSAITTRFHHSQDLFTSYWEVNRNQELDAWWFCNLLTYSESNKDSSSNNNNEYKTGDVNSISDDLLDLNQYFNLNDYIQNILANTIIQQSCQLAVHGFQNHSVKSKETAGMHRNVTLSYYHVSELGEIVVQVGAKQTQDLAEDGGCLPDYR